MDNQGENEDEIKQRIISLLGPPPAQNDAEYWALVQECYAYALGDPDRFTTITSNREKQSTLQTIDNISQQIEKMDTDSDRSQHQQILEEFFQNQHRKPDVDEPMDVDRESYGEVGAPPDDFPISHSNSGDTRSGSVSSPPQPANVVSEDHRRFLSNLYLNRELDRLASFAHWPMSRTNISPASLAKSGFFYLGNLDRAQCFSCEEVLSSWSVEDDAQAEHHQHSPMCPMLHGSEDRNVPIPEQPETAEQLLMLYPCQYPANPNMQSAEERLVTFQNGWPGRINATPTSMAISGFFYTGERDSTRCWYCNGVIQEWQYDGDPWVEHVKWFPTCQFLLQTKGQHFVHQHLVTNLHLARPAIAKQEGAIIDQPPQDSSRYTRQALRDRSMRTLSSLLIPSTDSQSRMQERTERINQNITNSKLVRIVLEMGFPETKVRSVLKVRLVAGIVASPNDIFGSVEELLDAVIDKQDGQLDAVENIDSPGTSQQQQSRPNSKESLEARPQNTEEVGSCKICCMNAQDTLFLPCCHICCCAKCADELMKRGEICPLCRAKINEVMKVHIS